MIKEILFENYFFNIIKRSKFFKFCLCETDPEYI